MTTALEDQRAGRGRGASPFSANTVPVNIMVERGEAEYIYDDDGRQMLDFCSQSLNLSLGHRHPAVHRAIIEAMGSMTYLSSRMNNRYFDGLASAVVRVAPPEITKVNLKVISATDANEAALKAAYKLRGTREVCALMGSHHGQSVETMRVSGKNFGRSYLDRTGVHFVEPCCAECWLDGGDSCDLECARAVAELVEQRADALAAVILEPLLVDAGVLEPPRAFMAAVREVTARIGAVMILDEAQTGFGWTGSLFACEWQGITPDIITLGKGFAAGMPLAASLLRSWCDVLDNGEHEITHGGHPLACAAALANIELLTSTDLMRTVVANGEYFLTLLHSLRSQIPGLGAIRGRGHIIGIEVDEAELGRTAKHIAAQCLAAGLLVRTSKVGERSNVIQFKPPLITRRQSFDSAVEILASVLRS